ncbi:MAG: MFS transporter [Thermotogae bacterium]|nr:MFS transporter [Thermotogota bacterium]
MPASVYLLASIRFILALSFSVAWPFIPLYLTDRGLSPFGVGLFMTSVGFFGTLVRPFAGALSDRFGRVRLIRFLLYFRSLILFLTFLFLLGDASLLGLFILLFLIVVGFASFIPIADSYVAEASGPNNRVMGFGLIRLAINGGFALGSFVASLMLNYGYAVLFLVSSVLVFVAATLSFKLREVENGAGLVRKIVFTLPDLRFFLFSVVSMSVFILSSQLINNFSIFAHSFLGIEKRSIAYLFTLNGTLILLFQIPFSALAKRIGYVLSTLLGGMGWALAFLITFVASGYSHLVLAVVFMTLSEMIVVPVVIASASDRAPTGRMGAYMGFWSTFQGLGYTFGPAWGGFFLEHLGRRAWVILSLQSLITGVALSFLRPIKRSPLNSDRAEG